MKRETAMKIMDSNGFEINITDLDEAIEKADWFRELQHIPPVPSDRERQAYWSDVYEKLVQLKSDSNGNP